MELTGGCLCGGVRLRLSGEVRAPLVCHCEDCRRWHGAAPAFVAVPRAGLMVEGEVSWYAAPGKPPRGFCPTCGSSLLWSAPERDTIGVVAGVVDQPTGLSVAGHIFTADRADYDPPPPRGLPTYPGPVCDGS
ncbi:GFA family protein [Nocardioides rotundus]